MLCHLVDKYILTAHLQQEKKILIHILVWDQHSLRRENVFNPFIEEHYSHLNEHFC